MELDEKNCKPCSAELNQYESDIYTTLINWLESITCIPWIKGYADTGEPDDPCDINRDLQYGVVYIETVDDQEVTLGEIIEVGETEHCRRVAIRSIVSVNLGVYNYSTTGLNGSPLDVLLSVSTSYKTLYALYSELCMNGLAVNSWGVVYNIADKENGTQKYRAQQNVDFEITRYTSFAETRLEEIKLSFNCCNETMEY